jgi:hypothetical protein
MLGDPEGHRRALAAFERLDSTVVPKILRAGVHTFAGHALLVADDPRSVEVLARAQSEALERGEVWWLAETLRLRANAERRFGDVTLAPALLDEARRVAAEQGAQLLVDRLASPAVAVAVDMSVE